MNRIDKILKHDLFLYHLNQNNTAEADRRFCRHNMGHFLDVARIAEIMNMEERLGIDREVIYAAALLHDCGKHMQYEEGIPHEEAGGKIAPEILKECGFSENEINIITDAIINHRNMDIMNEASLRGILYRADKMSRACFACEAESECNWKNDRKNMTIRY